MCSRIKTKDVIHRCSQLQTALVSMPLDALYPLRIDHARTIHTQRLLPQIANTNSIGARAIPEVSLRLHARKRSNRRHHPTVKLKIIVRVKDVMLTIVLIVQSDLYALQALREDPARIHTIRVFAIGIATP